MRPLAKAGWAVGASFTVYVGVSLLIVLSQRHRPARAAALPPREIAEATVARVAEPVPATPLASAATASGAPAPDARPSAPAPVPGGASPTEQLAAALTTGFEKDAAATGSAVQRAGLIRSLFSPEVLGGNGQLEDISCKATMCRGVVHINAGGDREVFSRTLLSPDFARAVPGAVSVPVREKLSDGTVRATFYVHPESVFEPFRRNDEGDPNVDGSGR